MVDWVDDRKQLLSRIAEFGALSPGQSLDISPSFAPDTGPDTSMHEPGSSSLLP